MSDQNIKKAIKDFFGEPPSMDEMKASAAKREAAPPPIVSALFWLPRIEAAGLPVPRTTIIPYSHWSCLSLFDNECPEEFIRLADAVGSASAEIGFPCFLRSDLASAKHDGPSSYRIDSHSNVRQCVANTIEDGELKFGFGGDFPRAMLVREFLTLDAPFKAFGSYGRRREQMPVSREWRLFATPEECYCQHPYWPAETVEEHSPSEENWRELLADLHTVPRKMPELMEMAKLAAAACDGGAWSVDFCRDVDGKWWLVDMAPAKMSYHWPGCPKGDEA